MSIKPVSIDATSNKLTSTLMAEKVLPEKSAVIGSLFHDMWISPLASQPSLYAPANKESELADLVLKYDDITKPESGSKVYNRIELQKAYKLKKATDPLQIKPLKIVEMNTADKRIKVTLALRQWNTTARQEFQKCKGMMPKSKETAERMQFFEDLQAVIETSKRDINPKNTISAILDDEGTIQAVSITNPDASPNAWHVDWLMTAPHNHIEGHKSRVGGAGSALIEDAIVKSIRRQHLNPDNSLTQENLKKTAVTLEGSFSKGFYSHLFFEEEGPKGGDDLVLKGDNLFKFIDKYAGRAAF